MDSPSSMVLSFVSESTLTSTIEKLSARKVS